MDDDGAVGGVRVFFLFLCFLYIYSPLLYLFMFDLYNLRRFRPGA